MTSIHYQYLVGLTTVSNIISETCEAIWNYLQPKVLPLSIDTHRLLHIAKEFKDLWNFNHCIGAIDGKHVVIQVYKEFYYITQQTQNINVMHVILCYYIVVFIPLLL